MKTIKTATGISGKSAIGAIQVESHNYMGYNEVRIKGITLKGVVLKDELSIDKDCAIELANELLALCGVKKFPVKIVSISSERKVCTTENGTETDEIEIWAEAQVLLDKQAFVQTIRSSGEIIDRTNKEKARKEVDKDQLTELLKLLLGIGFSKEDIDLKKWINIDLNKLGIDIK